MPDVFPNFRVSRKFFGPAWLTQNGESALVGYALDAVKDAFIERLRQGLLARFPQNGPNGELPPDDALAAIGRDRRIIRGVNETSQAYASRLLQWLDTWRGAGNPYALMGQLAAYLGPLPSFRTVDVRGNWYSRDAGTNGAGESVVLNMANWDWDGAPDALTRWSRFWVVIYPNGFWTPGPAWGDPGAVWGTPERTWGSTATTDEVSTIRTIVRQWKPAGTRCVNIIIAFDPSSFNPLAMRDGAGLPNGTWGHWSKYVSGARVPARLSTARYWDGS